MINIKPDFTKPAVENYLGSNAVYHGYAGMVDAFGNQYTKEECDREADIAKDMGIKIARTYYRWYSYDFEKQEYNWDNEKSTQFNNWLKRMKDRGINVALQAGWCSPGDILSNSWNGVSPFTVPNNWEESVENYAKWVSETVHELIEVRGFTNIKYLVFFTEPGSELSDELKLKQWGDAVRAAHNRLVKDGRRHLVKFVGPNEAFLNYSKMLEFAYENYDDCMDIYSAHTYMWSPNVSRFDVHTGTGAVNISTPGGRAFQYVDLKPNTNYKISVFLKFKHEDKLNCSGYAIFGGFKYREERPTIDAGGEPTSRLNRTSTKLVELAKIGDTYSEFTHTFNSGSGGKSIVGIFYDGKESLTGHGAISVDDFNLYEEGSNENILTDSSFETLEGWNFLVASTTCGDTYNNWQDWVKMNRSIIKNGKPFWWDEYNIQYDARYSDPRHGALMAMASVSLMNAGCQTSLVWTTFDQQWPRTKSNGADGFVNGDHRCGVVPKVDRNLPPYPAFYPFALAMKYSGYEGSKVYNGGGYNGVYCSLISMPDGNKSIIVVSESEEEEEFNIKLNSEFSTNYNLHICDTLNVVPDMKYEIPKTARTVNASGEITEKIPPYGVMVYTTIKD